jgi:alpha,alpha-trehalase
LALKIRESWLETNQKVYTQTGKMTEKYNVVNTTLHGGGGEYPNQDGFGWTNGVFLKLLSDI